MKVNVAGLIKTVQHETMMTNAQIAEALDITTGRLSNMKKQDGLSLANIDALAKVAGMTGRQLFDKYKEADK
jgi:predicted XRE-type DNA-binding protein